MTPGTVEVTPLGGVGEFGKNCLIVRAGGQALVIDAGISFPDESLPGVDRVAPDFSCLAGETIAAILLTHGHEDHIGAMPLLLEGSNAPVYATPFTRALAERRLAETGRTIRWAGTGFLERRSAGPFEFEFLPVSHSVPQSAAIVVEAAGRRILHTGDFKLDPDSPRGEGTDLELFARRAAGCDLAVVDSTNAGRAGQCPSESLAREGLRREILGASGRVVVTTFSSHVARIQGAIEAGRAGSRRVAFLGRSIRDIADIGAANSYLSLPAGALVDAEDLDSVAPRRLLLVCAGSQGEPFSALYRLALGSHPDLRLSEGDRVILSSRTIPGRERAVSRVVDHLLRRGATVAADEPGHPDVHVSGHAYRGDLSRTIAAISPGAVLPAHGLRRDLLHCAAAAREAGVAASRIFVADNGDSVFLEKEPHLERQARPAGTVFLDAAGGSEIEGEVVRDRRLLGSEGVVVVLATMSARGPSRVVVVSRGLAAEAAEVAPAVERAAAAALRKGSAEERMDPEWARSEISVAVRRLCRRRFGARPLVVPIVAEG